MLKESLEMFSVLCCNIVLNVNLKGIFLGLKYL